MWRTGRSFQGGNYAVVVQDQAHDEKNQLFSNKLRKDQPKGHISAMASPACGWCKWSMNKSRSACSKSGISDRFCANLMMYGKRRTALRPEGSIFLRVLSASARTLRLSSGRKPSANARSISDATIWFPNLPSLARQPSTWLSNIHILKRVLLSPVCKKRINSRAQRCHKLLSEVAVKEIDANSRKVRPCKNGIPFP